MAFANEVRDFIDAFQVGAKVKDAYKRRQLEEQELEDKVSIAAAKQAAADKRFKTTHDLNERRLSEHTRLKESELGLREQSAADLKRYREDEQKLKRQSAIDLSGYRRGSLDIQGRRAAAAETAAKAKARKDRLAEDPTAILDEEEPVSTGSALPTQVTSSSGAAQAIPAATGKPQASTSASGVARAAGAANAVVPGAAVPVALAGGLKYLSEHFGLKGGIEGGTPAQKDGARRLFEGEGTMTPEEKQAIDSVLDEEDIANGVDPQELTESMRSIRILKRTYDKFNKIGRTEDANKIAASIIQSSRGVASMLGASALKKIQGGDLDGAAQDLIAAHDQIPDGKAVSYDPQSKTFTIRDEESGEEVEKGQVTPEMIFSLANGMKDGSAFYRIIMDAAKRDPSMYPPSSAAKSTKDDTLDPLKPDDFGGDMEPSQAVGSSIMAELSAMKLPDDTVVFEGKTPEEIVEQIGADSHNAIKDLGVMIAHYNGVNPEQAGKLALSVVAPDEGTDPEYTNREQNWNFKLINSDKNTMEIMTEDGTRLRLPARTAAALIKRGNKGLQEFALNLSRSGTEKEVGSAIRDSQLMETQDEAARSAKATAEKATQRKTAERAQAQKLSESQRAQAIPVTGAARGGGNAWGPLTGAVDSVKQLIAGLGRNKGTGATRDTSTRVAGRGAVTPMSLPPAIKERIGIVRANIERTLGRAAAAAFDAEIFGSPTRSFDTDVVESIHGPGNVPRGADRMSALPVRRLARK